MTSNKPYSSLDAAWNAVGSALWSNGGGSPYLSITCDLVGWCIVEAHNSNGGASVESEFASPDSIIAALHELAARLSSVADSEETATTERLAKPSDSPEKGDE